MTTQTVPVEREKLEQWLEALELWISDTDSPRQRKAIADIEEALAQPEHEPKCNPHPKAPHGFNRNASHANDRYTCECESWDAYEAGRLDGIAQEQAMYEVQRLGQEIQPEQEPCKTCGGTGEVETGIGMMVCDECHGATYTTPPQRKPLTREEANAVMTEAGYGAASAEELAHFFNGLRHGEAAHGIKE